MTELDPANPGWGTILAVGSAETIEDAAPLLGFAPELYRSWVASFAYAQGFYGTPEEIWPQLARTAEQLRQTWGEDWANQQITAAGFSIQQQPLPTTAEISAEPLTDSSLPILSDFLFNEDEDRILSNFLFNKEEDAGWIAPTLSTSTPAFEQTLLGAIERLISPLNEHVEGYPPLPSTWGAILEDLVSEKPLPEIIEEREIDSTLLGDRLTDFAATLLGPGTRKLTSEEARALVQSLHKDTLLNPYLPAHLQAPSPTPSSPTSSSISEATQLTQLPDYLGQAIKDLFSPFSRQGSRQGTTPMVGDWDGLLDELIRLPSQDETPATQYEIFKRRNISLSTINSRLSKFCNTVNKGSGQGPEEVQVQAFLQKLNRADLLGPYLSTGIAPSFPEQRKSLDTAIQRLVYPLKHHTNSPVPGNWEGILADLVGDKPLPEIYRERRISSSFLGSRMRDFAASQLGTAAARTLLINGTRDLLRKLRQDALLNPYLPPDLQVTPPAQPIPAGTTGQTSASEIEQRANAAKKMLARTSEQSDSTDNTKRRRTETSSPDQRVSSPNQ